MTDTVNRAAAKEHARRAAASARQHAKYRASITALPHLDDQPRKCSGCGGTLAQDEHQAGAHPGCEQETQTA